MKPCTLTVLSWEGELPRLGEYVKAARGRTAFRVIELVLPKRPARHVARLRCERHDPARLEADAVVHTWCWAVR